MTDNRAKIIVAEGDGIGPEITPAVLEILEAAGADLDIEKVLIGKQAVNAGYEDGMEPGVIEKIRAAGGILLKAPMETDSGKGYESLNVRLRRGLDLWANIRPAVTYPYIASMHTDTDLTIFRENTEDSYLGLTKVMTEKDAGFLKEMFGDQFSRLNYDSAKGTVSFGVQIISDEASRRIIQASHDFAKANGSTEVFGMSKPNILKYTDGRFKKQFELIAQLDPEHMWFNIVDAGAGRVASRPTKNGVVVTQNLYGDVLSDVIASLAHGGSLGLAPSVNIGGDRKNPVAMFEAVHGTAPDIAGQNKANPTAFLLSSLMMLNFIGKQDVALKIHDALMKTWEDNLATGDIVLKESGQRGTLTTEEFTQAVIANLGRKPSFDFNPGYLRNNYRAALPEPI